MKDSWMDGFRFEFVTSNGYDLGNTTGDYLASFWNKATKKEAVDRVAKILNDKECFTYINQKAIKVKKNMAAFVKSRNSTKK